MEWDGHRELHPSVSGALRGDPLGCPVRAGLHVLHPRVPPLDTQHSTVGLGPQEELRKGQMGERERGKTSRGEGRLSSTRQTG